MMMMMIDSAVRMDTDTSYVSVKTTSGCMWLAKNNLERINQATHNSIVSFQKENLSYQRCFIDPFHFVLGQLTTKIVLTLTLT